MKTGVQLSIKMDKSEYYVQEVSVHLRESHFQSSKQNTAHSHFASAASPRASASPDAIDPCQVTQGLEHTSYRNLPEQKSF